MLLSAWLSACAPPQGVQVAPPVEVPAAFADSGEEPAPEAWWTVFGDEALNDLVDEALHENLTLRAAWDRLDAARALAAKSGAPLLPAVDGEAGYGRTFTKRGGGPRTYVSDYSLGVAASYEVDLWGRIRSTWDADRLDAIATAEDVAAAGVTLTAEIAGVWCRLIELNGQLRLLDEQIATNEKQLAIIELKFRRGQVAAADVLQQRQVLESTKGDQALVVSSVEVLTNQLAVLIGRAPGEGNLFPLPETLPQIPPLPQTGVPAELIRRRPDVRAAEIRVQSADRRVAAAIADRFPKLSLTVRGETAAQQCRDLFDNWLASLAANLAAPLFDGGRRRAEVERTRAVVSERVNTYGQTVLTSIQEVADALAEESNQAEYVGSLDRQLELSRSATDQVLATYTQTGADFTRYLTTLLSHQALQRTVLAARRDLVLFRIDLYRALAGSFPLPRPAARTVGGPRAPVERPSLQRDSNEGNGRTVEQ